MTQRPADLPDFKEPPLDEVVFGVQFSPIGGYSSVLAKDVWSLFQEDFPRVQEQPALEPSFETFGGSNAHLAMQFRVGMPIRGRLWFVSKDQSQLLQFQEDRFLFNWRKRPTGESYPRFENVFESYSVYLRRLAEFFESNGGARLDVNQAEVAYINIIPLGEIKAASDWVKFIDLCGIDAEGVAANFNEVIRNVEGRPFARLFHELQSVELLESKAMALRLSLSFRGKPAGNDVEDALNFMKIARSKIVSRFADLTTKQGHENWGRVQ